MWADLLSLVYSLSCVVVIIIINIIINSKKINVLAVKLTFKLYKDLQIDDALTIVK